MVEEAPFYDSDIFDFGSGIKAEDESGDVSFESSLDEITGSLAGDLEETIGGWNTQTDFNFADVSLDSRLGDLFDAGFGEGESLSLGLSEDNSVLELEGDATEWWEMLE